MDKKKQQYINIYITSGCNKSLACRKANISRRTIYNWIEEDEEFKESLEDAYEELIDFAETTLIKKIQGITRKEIETRQVERDGKKKTVYRKIREIEETPDKTSTIFFLKTKGRKRGWQEKQVVENTNYNHDVKEEDLERVDKLTKEEKLNLIKTKRKLFGK